MSHQANVEMKRRLKKAARDLSDARRLHSAAEGDLAILQKDVDAGYLSSNDSGYKRTKERIHQWALKIELAEEEIEETKAEIVAKAWA